jgi:DNA-binding MarR family transcriptional regulator
MSRPRSSREFLEIWKRYRDAADLADGYYLTVSQVAFLLVIRQRDMTMSEVSEALGLHSSSVTRTRAPLVREGLVETKVDRRDLRSTIVSITRNGEHTLRAMFKEDANG